MKRRITVIAILAVLLLCGVVWARMTPVVAVQGVSAPVDPCPSGTFLGAWNGDYTSDTDKLCVDSGNGTAKDGTNNGTAVLGTDYGQTGVGVLVNAQDRSLMWAVSTADIFNQTTGTVWFSIYVNVASMTGAAQFWEVNQGSFSSSNNLYCYVSSSLALVCAYKGNSTQQTVGTADSVVTLQTWLRVKYTWDQSTGKHKVCVGATCQEDTETLTALSSTIAEFHLGEDQSAMTVAHPVWVDNVYSINSYDAADPL